MAVPDSPPPPDDRLGGDLPSSTLQDDAVGNVSTDRLTGGYNELRRMAMCYRTTYPGRETGVDQFAPANALPSSPRHPLPVFLGCVDVGRDPWRRRSHYREVPSRGQT
jgi:hypothetical protein